MIRPIERQHDNTVDDDNWRDRDYSDGEKGEGGGTIGGLEERSLAKKWPRALTSFT